jgi:glycosyltransferase involved in cell wall biosynthesis
MRMGSNYYKNVEFAKKSNLPFSNVVDYNRLKVLLSGIIVPFKNTDDQIAFNLLRHGYLAYVKEYYSWFMNQLDYDPKRFFDSSESSISLSFRHIFFSPDYGGMPLVDVPQTPIRIDANWILYASDQVKGFDEVLGFEPKVMAFPLSMERYSLEGLREFDDLLYMAKAAIEKGDFGKSEKLLGVLTKRYSKHADILKLQGRLEIAKGNFAAGFGYLEEAKSLNRHDRELVLLQAKAVSTPEELQLLRKSCFDYLKMYPDDAEVRNLQISIQEQEVEGFLSGCVHRPGADRPYKVTAIVSTYKSEAFMRGCLEDLVAQTIAENVEILVIDAASPEGEGEIVREFQRKYDNIHYYRTRERIGIYEAWNIAVKLARGEFITPFSTNDSVGPRSYEIMANYLQSHADVDLVFGDSFLTRTPHRKFDSFLTSNKISRAVLREEYSFEYNLLYCTVGPHPMWRKSLHERVGYFDESYRRVADQEFFMRVGRKYNIKHMPVVTGVYWEDENAISADKESLKELYIMRKHSCGVYSKEVLESTILTSFIQVIDSALQKKDYPKLIEMLKQSGNRLHHIPELQTLARSLNFQ